MIVYVVEQCICVQSRENDCAREISIYFLKRRTQNCASEIVYPNRNVISIMCVCRAYTGRFCWTTMKLLWTLWSYHTVVVQTRFALRSTSAHHDRYKVRQWHWNWQTASLIVPAAECNGRFGRLLRDHTHDSVWFCWVFLLSVPQLCQGVTELLKTVRQRRRNNEGFCYVETNKIEIKDIICGHFRWRHT